MPGETRPTATQLLRQGVGLALRPPFVWLVLLAILATLATAPIEREDLGALVGITIVSLVSFYAVIALTLAAAEEVPDRSPEVWVRAAFARKCFWRTLGTLVFATVLVFAGLLALIVPAFFIGASIAAAGSAAVLENHGPGNAIRRSLELTKPARGPIGVVYGLLVIVPGGALQLAFYFVGPEETLLLGAAQTLTVALSSIAQIALTKAFLQLGGRKLAREVPPPKPEPS